MSSATPRHTSGPRVYVARLAGTDVFDPLGDRVGRVHDVVVLLRARKPPRAVGLVVEVASKRRVFVPLSRVTSIDAGAVITTGLVNIRRFAQRANETLVVAELLDRQVAMRDGSGTVVVEDMAMEQQRNRDWLITKVFVRRRGSSGLRLKRGAAFVVEIDEIRDLAATSAQQGATALLATLEGLKPADLADVLHDLNDTRRLEVAQELDDQRLADVLAELGEED
ncbi:magnesium transporter, partial [Georgenia sp. 10Sc9-8]|nr:magnesium transporter [Georgenia halotolerans]